MVVKKTVAKKVRKDIRTLKRGLKAEKKTAKKLTKALQKVRKRAAKNVRTVAARTANLSKDMEKLQRNMETLQRKKTPKKQLSEYNLFMRRQLRKGVSFSRAVKLWKSYKRGEPKVVVKTKTRTVVRRVPVVRTRTVVRKVPVVKTRTIIRRVPQVRTIVKKVDSANNAAHSTALYSEISKIIKASTIGGEQDMSEEEIALKLTMLYFQEVHRLGLKRRLELDDVIDAYYTALSKVRGKKTVVHEVHHISEPKTESKVVETHTVHTQH